MPFRLILCSAIVDPFIPIITLGLPLKLGNLRGKRLTAISSVPYLPPSLRSVYPQGEQAES